MNCVEVKRKFCLWLFDKSIEWGRFQFVRKAIGGHWERWVLLGRPENDPGSFFFENVWFDRTLTGNEGGFTIEGLPILRGKLDEENWP